MSTATATSTSSPRISRESLHVLDGRNGHDLPGWPQPCSRARPAPPRWSRARRSPTSIATASKQIIVGAGSLDVAGQQGGVVAFNANGSVRFRLQTMTAAGQNGVSGTPAVGDVNGDGYPDIVFGSFDHRIYALNRYGARFPASRWTASTPSGTHPRSTTTRAHRSHGHLPRRRREPRRSVRHRKRGRGSCARSASPAFGPQVLWSRCRHQIYQSSPAIGDLDGSGRMALVVGTGTGPSGDAFATNSLTAFYLDDGSTRSGLARGAERPDLRLAGDRRRERRPQERRGRDRVRDVQRRSRVGVQRPRRRAVECCAPAGAHRDPVDADPRRPRRQRRQ